MTKTNNECCEKLLARPTSIVFVPDPHTVDATADIAARS